MLQKEENNKDTIKLALNCALQDETGLNDFQKLPDATGICIPRVGINRFRMPLQLPAGPNDLVKSHDCQVSMYVNLPKGKTGINMSRLCATLQAQGADHVIDFPELKNILNQYRYNLRDSETDKPFDQSYIKISFHYPLKQQSLKSDNWGWQYYHCEMKAVQTESTTRYFLTVNYEYSSTCPCSLSMARQYEKDYQEGLTSVGSGVAVAHGQRSNCQTTVELTEFAAQNGFFVKDLVELLRSALPTETQSLVKRVDEQAFAIVNGENPMFVEHASKRTYKVLNEQEKYIADWIASFEHYESLHSHNAVAVIYKGIPGGLQTDSVF